jgi:glycosyltransferase involved in cell wall biosynthesis
MSARICFVTASPSTLHAFLRDHIRALSTEFEFCAVSNFQEDPEAVADTLPCEMIAVNLKRKVAPVVDVQALWRLYRIFKSRRFEVVHTVTPKAGLLGMLAARLAGVQHRVHTFTGQVWSTRRGISRAVLAWGDRAIALLASQVLADSLGQLRFLRAQGVLRGDQGLVLGEGSITGVDVQRFRPDPSARAAERRALGVGADALVILYIGRLTKDKGVLELVRAFRDLVQHGPALYLVLAGPDEESLSAALRREAGPAVDRVRLVGFTDRPERLMAASDVLCLPSHREGFGSVVIEAAAVGLPSVVSRIYGLVDAIVEGVTGLFHEAGNDQDLRAVLQEICDDDTLRLRLGSCARERAITLFDKQQSIVAWRDFYRSMLASPAGEHHCA